MYAPTNVYKMYLASTDPDAHYERGPGNEGDYDEGNTSWVGYQLGQSGGYGMSGILDTAWQELVADRKHGDTQVDIIGFSRGAIEATEFANRIAETLPDETIRFVGLFDPVGSVGIPWSFGDYRATLPNSVQRAAEATSIDENRFVFPGTNVPGTTIQKFFNGMHADIGGGWAGHSLSDVTLMWMTEQAQAVGVGLNLQKEEAETGISITPNPNDSPSTNQGSTSYILNVGQRPIINPEPDIDPLNLALDSTIIGLSIDVGIAIGNALLGAE